MTFGYQPVHNKCSILIKFVEFAVIAKLQSQPKPEAGTNNGKEGKEKKPQDETKAAIMQSLRTKLNKHIQEDGKFLICIQCIQCICIYIT